MYFTRSGSVSLNTQAITTETLRIRWLDLQSAQWQDETTANAAQHLQLTTPDPDKPWAVVIRTVEQPGTE